MITHRLAVGMAVSLALAPAIVREYGVFLKATRIARFDAGVGHGLAVPAKPVCAGDAS